MNVLVLLQGMATYLQAEVNPGNGYTFDLSDVNAVKVGGLDQNPRPPQVGLRVQRDRSTDTPGGFGACYTVPVEYGLTLYGAATVDSNAGDAGAHHVVSLTLWLDIKRAISTQWTLASTTLPDDLKCLAPPEFDATFASSALELPGQAAFRVDMVFTYQE